LQGPDNAFNCVVEAFCFLASSTRIEEANLVTATTIEKKVTPARLMSRREVMERVTISYPKIWQMMRDGKFPRGRELGGKIVWLETEIDGWIAQLPVKPLKGEKGAKPWRSIPRHKRAGRRGPSP
jgi:predicted DNA-binding transcriptional regulator AlpA